MEKLELLAPAGDAESLKAAIRFGADAVYCGGPFMQLRADSAGFSLEALADSASAVHAAGRKIYVTVNSFANSDEIALIGGYAKQLYAAGIDAVIVSDIGALAAVKEACPELDIHISTQANTMNYKAAEVYYNMGATRIVLARELSIEKIAELRAGAPEKLELEAFVHGAMCMSYSGRCLLSSYLAGRSGNRGQCAQSCRWNYYLMEEKRPGEYYKIEEDEHGSTILSSKELCAIELLDRLKEAGVSSFKIEGRMRTPFYTSTVVNAYRLAIDKAFDLGALRAELDTVSHRPFTTGFYLGDKSGLQPDGSGYIRDYMFIGTVTGKASAGRALIETRNPFRIGDELELLSPGRLGLGFRLESIVNSEGEAIERSNTPMRLMSINMPYEAAEGDIIRARISSKAK